MRFSIITPFYNIENYVEKCVESVLNQTYVDYEFIAVDDGSTDSTANLLDKYAKIDTRIKVIHKKNGGLTSARKAGAKESNGDYIVILDGDDWIKSNYLEALNNAINVSHADIIITDYYEAYEERSIKKSPFGRVERYGFFDKEQLEKEYYPVLFSTLPIVWAKAFKRDIYMKYQMALDDKITMGEDGAISYPCILAADSIFTVNEAFYYYRQNPLSMTKHPKKYLSWDAAIDRIEHMERILPLEKYAIKEQLYGMASHSIFNVVASHFRHDKFFSVRKETLSYMSPSVLNWLRIGAKESSGINRVLAFVLYKRFFVLIKVWTMLNK